jgi:hypothetical protein
MKFGVFEAMSKEEAHEYLSEFLVFGKNRGMKIIEENIHFTVDLDFSIESLAIVFRTLIPILNIVPREPDPKVPEFIRNTDDYQKGLFDFDEASNKIILAAAYYLGETFVRAFPQLKWATGNTDYLQGNMPVVTGFKFRKELSPILVAENIFASIVSQLCDDTSIDIAIGSWMNNVPG